MAASIHRAFSNLSTMGYTKPKPPPEPRRLGVRCEVGVAEKRSVTVKNGNDSLEICRVLNGMWQTSGGWGRIDRDDAVEAMLRYADAGLSTFDMADHCKFHIYPPLSVSVKFFYFENFELTDSVLFV